MTRRTNSLLRDYVDLLAWSAEVGQITTYAAAVDYFDTTGTYAQIHEIR